MTALENHHVADLEARVGAVLGPQDVERDSDEIDTDDFG
jgi:hypothetical protein